MKIPMQIKNGLRALNSACALVCLSAIPLSAEEPYVHWATTKGGHSDNGGDAIAVTGEGELLVSNYGALMKFSPRGELVSSNVLAGVALGGVASDGLGNLYWTGRVYAEGTFDYPPVQGFFVGKFGPKNDLLWVRNNEMEDSSSYTEGRSIRVDSEGNIAVGGSSLGSLKLGSFESDAEEGSPFFCKYDANGNLLWARTVATQFTGPSSGGGCREIGLDGLGNVIVCGFLQEGSADFGGTTVYPGTTGHSYGGDWFVAKYRPSGELLWVTLDYGTSLAVDKLGDIYTAVEWSKENVSGFAKLNGSSDLLWKKYMPYANGYQSLTLDEKGQPVFTGGFTGTAQFDAITLRGRDNNYGDFFVAKTDVDGNVLWAIAGGGPEFDAGKRVACDSAGNVFLTAVVRATAGSFDGIRIVPNSPVMDPTLVVARLSDRPPLEMARSGGGVQISWPAKATNYVLQAATSLAPGSAWVPVLTPPTTVGRQSTAPVDTTAPAQFFRLHKP